MTAEYAKPDWRVVDYEIFSLSPAVIDRQTRAELLLRGPKPERLTTGCYFACLGAAQVFGRFCEKPFPTLLGKNIQLDVLNLGRGGAGPSFFSEENEQLLEYINNARFAIVQVMSGRSESNSLFESRGLGYYYRRVDGVGISCDQAFRGLRENRDTSNLEKILLETRENWIKSYQNLFDSIRVPKILFWFSERYPNYEEQFDSLDTLFAEFPQLVNQEMVSHIAEDVDDYVECVTSAGLPHQLIDRFTGMPATVEDPWAGPWTENCYYPSPDMHLEAATLLTNVCRKYVG